MAIIFAVEEHFISERAEEVKGGQLVNTCSTTPLIQGAFAMSNLLIIVFNPVQLRK